MATTPLLVAILGLVTTAGGTLGGVWITQRRSDRRETIAWERQREREREAWAREDAARTFDRRRDGYVALYKAANGVVGEYVKAVSARLHAERLGREDVSSQEFSRKKGAALGEAIGQVTIYGSSAIVALSWEFATVMKEVRANLGREGMRRILRKNKELLEAMRDELGIPKGAIESPTSNTLDNKH